MPRLPSASRRMSRASCVTMPRACGSVTAAIYVAVSVFAVGERARSFKAISPGLLPPLGSVPRVKTIGMSSGLSLRLPRHRRGPYFLRARFHRPVQARGRLRRPHSQGREARRPVRTSADQVRTRHQPQDCQGARARNSVIGAGPRRRGDRVMRRAPVHHAYWRRGRLAARGTRAAGTVRHCSRSAAGSIGSSSRQGVAHQDCDSDPADRGANEAGCRGDSGSALPADNQRGCGGEQGLNHY
jgi:hypothetical protein